MTTDDFQGQARRPVRAEDLKVKKCFVINDNQTYGQGVAKAFADCGQEAGHRDRRRGGVGRQAAQLHRAVRPGIKASGADCVYIGGIYDNNGGQLIKDKVAVLGDNDGDVKLMAPDGFTGYPDMLKLPESEGMYLTFAGLDPGRAASRPAAAGGKLFEAYKAKYGEDPDGSLPAVRRAAMQVILAAIEKSDGTRKGVTEAVFEGEGITIPADQSVVGKEIKIDPATGDINAQGHLDRARQGRQGDVPQGLGRSSRCDRQPPGAGLFRARRFSSTLASQSVCSEYVRSGSRVAREGTCPWPQPRWRSVARSSRRRVRLGPIVERVLGYVDPRAGGRLDRGERRLATRTASSGRCSSACRTARCTR